MLKLQHLELGLAVVCQLDPRARVIGKKVVITEKIPYEAGL